MNHIITEMELIFATHNKNKVNEILLLLPSNFKIKTLDELNYSDSIIENSDSIEGNALIKARSIFNRFKKNCFADDSGLEVNALDGEPGVKMVLDMTQYFVPKINI